MNSRETEAQRAKISDLSLVRGFLLGRDAPEDILDAHDRLTQLLNDPFEGLV